MNGKQLVCWAALLACLIPAMAHAHAGHAENGFISGVLHPVFGLDHFLAMLSVGIVSAQLGGAKIYLIPAMFIGAMIVGAIIGVYGYQWPASELGIALSVILLGLAIAFIRRGNNAAPVMLCTTLFGALHGHAHGLEMPTAADPVFYAGGFLLSTAAIHVLGVGVGYLFTKTQKLQVVLRLVGILFTGIGLTFALQ